MMSVWLQEWGLTDDDYDYDEDDLSASLECVRQPFTLGMAFEKPRIERQLDASFDETRKNTAVLAHKARIQADMDDIVRRCEDLQKEEIDAIERFLTLHNAVHVLPGGNVKVRVRVDDGIVAQFMCCPTYPLRSTAHVVFEYDGFGGTEEGPPVREVGMRRVVVEEAVYAACGGLAGECVILASVERAKLALSDLVDRMDEDVGDPRELRWVAELETLYEPSEEDDEEIAFAGKAGRAQLFDAAADTKRVGATGTLIGNLLYVVGGRRVAKAAPKTDEVPLVQVYDMAAKTWFTPKTVCGASSWKLELVQRDTENVLPLHRREELYARSGHATVRVGAKLYVFGGVAITTAQSSHMRFRSSPINEKRALLHKLGLCVLDTKTFEWTLHETPFEFDYRDFTATKVGSRIFLIGGVMRYNTVGRFVYVLDLNTHEWLEWPVGGCPECYFWRYEAARWAKKICKTCRYVEESNNAFMALHMRMQLPSLCNHTATRLGRFILLFGGTSQGSVSNKSYLLDTDTLALSVLDAGSPCPRRSHCAVRIGQRFVAMVGGFSMGGTMPTSVDVFDAYTKTFVYRRINGLLMPRAHAIALPFHSGIVMLGGVRAQGASEQLVPHGYGLRPMVCISEFAMPPLMVELGLPSGAPASAIVGFLRSLMGEEGDVTFRGRGLHRPVLQARCPALLAMIEGSTPMDADVVAVDDVGLDQLIRFVYTGDQPLPKELGGEVQAAARALGLTEFGQGQKGASYVGEQIAAFFDNEEARAAHADLVFVCGEERIPAHRVFVLRASYFRLLLNAGMSEAQTGEITIDGGVDSVSVKAVLRFLYSDELAVPAENALEVLSLADQYGMDSLKAHVERLMMQTFDFEDCGSVLTVAEYAQRHKAQRLFKLSLATLRSDFDAKDVLATMKEEGTSPALSTVVRSVLIRGLEAHI